VFTAFNGGHDESISIGIEKADRSHTEQLKNNEFFTASILARSCTPNPAQV
jgi:hypothetical protein